MRSVPRTVLVVSLAALSAHAAAGEFSFTFAGTIQSGQAIGGPDLTGQRFAFTLFIQDTAADLTPSLATANYRLARAEMDIGADGSVEETSVPNPAGFATVYIDPGATQLIGGADLFNPQVSFLLGAFVPGGAFADPKDLSGQSAFSLTGLTGSTLSYYSSANYSLTLDPDGFGFNAAVIPLPAPVAMGALGLVGVAWARRRVLSR